MLRGEQCDPKKVFSVAQFGCRIPHTASFLRKQSYRTKPPVCRSATTVSSVSSPAASPLAHRHRAFEWLAYVCLLCVADKDDMRCELDYSEGEARSVNVTLSS